MQQKRSVVRVAAALVAVSLLGLGTAAASAATTEREVVVPDPVGDVESNGEESERLVSATDVTKVVYRFAEAPAHDNNLAVKIRIHHGRTLTGAEHKHRAVTRFTHNTSDYRLVHTLSSGRLFVLKDDTWTRVHAAWMSVKGGDGLMVVKFPVSALGRAFTMEDLRTRLRVTNTSIVDRTTTDEGLPVFPPR